MGMGESGINPPSSMVAPGDEGGSADPLSSTDTRYPKEKQDIVHEKGYDIFVKRGKGNFSLTASDSELTDSSAARVSSISETRDSSSFLA